MNAPRTRVVRRPVHGVLLIDKPLGMTSNQALQKAKWLLRAEKAGHTGTLDPLASGVLPLCFGAATKFSQLQLEAAKTYEAIALLGTTTTTGDAEGEVLQQCAVEPSQITPERLAAVQQQFTGAIVQVPPMYSALKRDGKALYEYARAGVEVERAPRPVTIHALKLTPTQTDKAQAAIKIIVTCSKGTYIRTLGEDIGAALGCGAHLVFLRRIDTGASASIAASRWSNSKPWRKASVWPAWSRPKPCWCTMSVSRWMVRMRGVSSRDCAAVVPGPTRLLWPCLANSPMPCWGWVILPGGGAGA